MTMTIYPNYISSWYSDYTPEDELQTTPFFSIHKWLAFEAVTMLPDAQVQWIRYNLKSFWHGVEAPNQASIASYYGLDVNNYGDIDSLVLYLNASGTSVTDNSLALRAQDEYEKLVDELSNYDANYTQTAFHAGAVNHYVSQAGVWGAIWDESLWGTLSTGNWMAYEQTIENGNVLELTPSTDVNFRFQNISKIGNIFYNLNTSKIAPDDAYNTTIDLAMNINSIAQDQGNDFVGSITEAILWEAGYYNDSKSCLERSVEAIYATLKHAVEAANLDYIYMESPEIYFDEDKAKFEVKPFSVNAHFEGSEIQISNSEATTSEFYFIYFDNYSRFTSISEKSYQLSYNSTAGKWYRPYSYTEGLIVQATHYIMCKFKIVGSPLAWSNLSTNSFDINFYNFTVSGYDYSYDRNNWSLDIFDIQLSIPDMPDIGILDDTEVTDASWELYYGSQDVIYQDYIIGNSVIDTQGNRTKGSLIYDDQSMTWNSVDNDIGWVFTPNYLDCFVVIKYNVTNIPIGTLKNSPYGAYVYHYLRVDRYDLFKTRFHWVTISQPEIEYNRRNQTLSISNVHAYQDYRDIELDYYEIFEKSIYGGDRRTAKWMIFHIDGAETALNGDLIWDSENQYWYFIGLDVSGLVGWEYYVKCRFSTMNTDNELLIWSPLSDSVEIKPASDYNDLIYLLILIPFIIVAIMYVVSRYKKSS